MENQYGLHWSRSNFEHESSKKHLQRVVEHEFQPIRCTNKHKVRALSCLRLFDSQANFPNWSNPRWIFYCSLFQRTLFSLVKVAVVCLDCQLDLTCVSSWSCHPHPGWSRIDLALIHIGMKCLPKTCGDRLRRRACFLNTLNSIDHITDHDWRLGHMCLLSR